MSYVAGTNVSIGDKWAAEISAEVKKAVASAFDSKYGRRSTMSFTGESRKRDILFDESKSPVEVQCVAKKYKKCSDIVG